MATAPSSLFNPLLLLVTTLISLIGHLSPRPSSPSLPALRVDREAIAAASTDFGRLVSASPAAVLHPSSPLDIAALIRASHGSPNPFGVSARGRGHSVRGQALAPGGVVVDMAALGEARGQIVVVGDGEAPYADVGGEQLWIDVLHETLRHGLAPLSWTDYLYLTVGGTLSNAGVSGQAFRHGPQISNVHELDVITGKGEMVTCSEKKNMDLFFAVLGGLGQFGIITRARIALAPAPRRARWARLIYVDFAAFTRDQERLIAAEKKGFDYVEGSLLMDHSLSSNWRSSFFSEEDLGRIGQLAARHGAIYCLEASLYHDHDGDDDDSSVDQRLQSLLEELSYVPGFSFTNDVSYTSFLNRVYDGEMKLRSMGLWDVPHPWLNLFVPKSRMADFDQGVFKGILKHNSSIMGPILIYPMNKNKWDERMSAVIPGEEIFYSIGLLRSATIDNWKSLEDQNEEIVRFCDHADIDFKQYLPHYRRLADWRKHFGAKWDMFVTMKRKYDPKAILSPGQQIFTSPLAQLVFSE